VHHLSLWIFTRSSQSQGKSIEQHELWTANIGCVVQSMFRGSSYPQVMPRSTPRFPPVAHGFSEIRAPIRSSLTTALVFGSARRGSIARGVDALILRAAALAVLPRGVRLAVIPRPSLLASHDAESLAALLERAGGTASSARATAARVLRHVYRARGAWSDAALVEIGVGAWALP